MSKKSNIKYSKFWLGDNFDVDKEFDKDDTMDLIRLATFRRAVSNFVFILTGKSVPVRFPEGGTSRTNGKVVYIGGELSRGEFDSTVGLALHESMHIVKSDFDLIKNMWQKVPKKIYDASKNKLSKPSVAKFVKYILNVVEDRYIDAWAYETAPGYRGYYTALYNRYFNRPEVDEGLKSDALRTPTLKAYRFRFTNITNKNTDLDALPGLRDIYNLLNLKDILRHELSSPKDRMNLAVEICEIIIKNIIKVDEEKNKKQSDPKDDDESGDEPSDLDPETDNEESPSEEPSEDISDENPNEEETNSEEKQKELCGDCSQDSGDLSDKDAGKLEKAIQKQEDLVNHDVKQSDFDEQTISKLNLLEKSGVDLIAVGGEQGIPPINCVVVKNMTRELMETDDFPYTTKISSLSHYKHSEDGVHDGVVLGTMLGHRLQVRGESRITKFNRLEKGKFDRKLIAELGFNSDRVFFQTQTDQYKNAYLHISVDASSSMTDKWQRTMTTVVALAKAASMINNLDVTISFRSGAVLNKKNLFSYNEIPYVVIAYDSRKDKFSKIIQLFPMLVPFGSTPEGLAFEAILDTIPASTLDLDSYFVNLSDGEPMFSQNYFGQVAWMHTRRQVNKIRESGIEILSYFVEQKGITNERIENNIDAFKVMYGKDAQLVDVNSVTEIALTMNLKFLVSHK